MSVERDDYDFTPRTLRNRGVPVRLARVERLIDASVRGYSPSVLEAAGIGLDELPRGAPQVVLDENDEPLVEVVHVKFTHNVLADLEEHFGSIEQWQLAMSAKPIGAMRQTLAFCLGRDAIEVGLAMLEDERLWYESAIGVAWALANGLDPTRAAMLLSKSVAAVAQLHEQNLRDVETHVDELQQIAATSAPNPSTS